jgi:hypothetical protein
MRLVAWLAWVGLALSVCACSGSSGSGGGSGGSGGSGGGFGLGSPCGSNPSATVSFDTDIDGHVSLTQTGFNGAYETGVYFKGSNVTEISIYQGTPGLNQSNVDMYFMGNQAKSEALGTPTQGALEFSNVSVHILLLDSSGQSQGDYFCCNDTTPAVDSGTLAVTAFGAVGQQIAGTFEGSFDGAKVSNGSFSVTRCQDGL